MDTTRAARPDGTTGTTDAEPVETVALPAVGHDSRTHVRAVGAIRYDELDRTVTSGGWGPVLSGAVSGFITFVILSSLWLALTGSGAGFVSGNLEWFQLASAIVAALVAGFVAGWLQPRKATAGGMQGFAAWGLLIFASLIVGVPSAATLFSGATNLTLDNVTAATGGNVDLTSALGPFSTELWAVFATFAGGALAAILAGAAAGRMHAKQHEHRAEGGERVIDMREPSHETSH